MNVSFADSYLKSYEALSTQERKSVDKSIKFFQENPRHPGLAFGKLDTQDFGPDLYKFRCSAKVVAIVRKDGETYDVCYVDHWDDAFKWAGRFRG